MKRASIWTGVAIGFALCACAVDAPETPAHVSQGIAGGATDTGDPAVVALVDSSGAEHCTGTLIAPLAVLTAGHCAGVTGGAVFGATASAARRVAIASVDRNPHFVGEGHGYDVAVVHLASAVTDVEPVPIADRALPTTAIGMTVRHVGFGVTNDTTGVGRGTKRTVSYPFTRFDADPGLIWSGNVSTDAQTCNGDSGGPGLFVVDGHEQIVSLVSSGPACPAPEGNDARIDLADIRAWIRATAALCTPGVSYCGGDLVPGDAGTLYQCTDGNHGTVVTACAAGCAVVAGRADACRAGAASDGGDASASDASALDAGDEDDADDGGVRDVVADGAEPRGPDAGDERADGAVPAPPSCACRAACGRPHRSAASLGALALAACAIAWRRRRRTRARTARTALVAAAAMASIGVAAIAQPHPHATCPAGQHWSASHGAGGHCCGRGREWNHRPHCPDEGSALRSACLTIEETQPHCGDVRAPRQ